MPSQIIRGWHCGIALRLPCGKLLVLQSGYKRLMSYIAIFLSDLIFNWLPCFINFCIVALYNVSCICVSFTKYRYLRRDTTYVIINNNNITTPETFLVRSLPPVISLPQNSSDIDAILAICYRLGYYFKNECYSLNFYRKKK